MPTGPYGAEVGAGAPVAPVHLHRGGCVAPGVRAVRDLPDLRVVRRHGPGPWSGAVVRRRVRVRAPAAATCDDARVWAQGWEPEPDWQPLRVGPSGQPLWRVERGDGAWVVKRLVRPVPGDPGHLSDPTHPAWWRREADVATAPRFVDGPGLVPAPVGVVEEDEGGVLVWVRELVGEPPTGLQVAACLGRFAAAPAVDPPPWAARRQLRTRLRLAEHRGGWRTLARTTLADVTDALWRRRGHWLDRLDEGPQGRVHGDAVPSNLLTTSGDDVVATDWQCAGTGPVGADLGYWALSSREDFAVLLEAFVAGVRRSATAVDAEAVGLAARVTAAYSVLSRAEWALAQVAPGEGALAGKFRHPAVAPYLRAVQRQLPQVEALL